LLTNVNIRLHSLLSAGNSSAHRTCYNGKKSKKAFANQEND
jgi:hypothetical protein